MADEREQFTFDGVDNNFGILATNTIAAEDVANFLNSDPDDITPIKPVEKKDESVKKPPQQSQQPQKKEDLKKEEAPEEKQETPKKPSQEEVMDIIFGENEKEEEKGNEENNKEGEDDEVIKKISKKDDDNKDGGKEGIDDNTFTVLSKELFNLGVFKRAEDENEEAFPDNGQAFLDRFEYEKRKDAIGIVDNFLSRFGDDYKEMFENVFVKGIAPQDYLQRYSKVESIKGLDIENSENQERIVRESLKRNGYSASAIDSKIEKFKHYGDLEDEAKIAQELLLKKEEEDLAKSIQEKQQELEDKKLIKDTFVNNVSKILTEKIKEKEFDGIPVDQKTANEIAAYLTREKWQTPKGELLTEFDKDMLDLSRPENHATKVKVALLLKMLKDDPTLSKIKNKAASKKNTELFSSLDKDIKKNSSKGSNTSQTKGSQTKDNITSSWF